MLDRLIDLALVALVLEAAFLVVRWRRRGRRGMHPRDVLAHLAAGALLMLAVRNEVGAGPRLVTVLLLAASLPAHLVDLVRQLRAAERSADAPER